MLSLLIRIGISTQAPASYFINADSCRLDRRRHNSQVAARRSEALLVRSTRLPYPDVPKSKLRHLEQQRHI